MISSSLSLSLSLTLSLSLSLSLNDVSLFAFPVYARLYTGVLYLNSITLRNATRPSQLRVGNAPSESACPATTTEPPFYNRLVTVISCKLLWRILDSRRLEISTLILLLWTPYSFAVIQPPLYSLSLKGRCRGLVGVVGVISLEASRDFGILFIFSLLSDRAD